MAAPSRGPDIPSCHGVQGGSRERPGIDRRARHASKDRPHRHWRARCSVGHSGSLSLRASGSRVLRRTRRDLLASPSPVTSMDETVTVPAPAPAPGFHVLPSCLPASRSSAPGEMPVKASQFAWAPNRLVLIPVRWDARIRETLRDSPSDRREDPPFARENPQNASEHRRFCPSMTRGAAYHS